MTRENRAKLRCVMAERKLKGLAAPLIASSGNDSPEADRILITVWDLLGAYPLNPLEFFDRALLNLARLPQLQHPAGQIALGPAHEALLFSVGLHAQMIEQLIAIGYLGGVTPGNGWFRITGRGWERIEKLKTPGADSQQAFVAMWFDEAQRVIFDKAIQPAIEADGVTRALRIDLKEHNGKIDDEIIAEIRRSRYLVADFTGQRGGVYYEAGFAQGLNLPVIWIVQKDELEAVHFDARQYNFIPYTDAADLHPKLLNRIRATAV